MNNLYVVNPGAYNCVQVREENIQKIMTIMGGKLDHIIINIFGMTVTGDFQNDTEFDVIEAKKDSWIVEDPNGNLHVYGAAYTNAFMELVGGGLSDDKKI